MIRMIFFVLAFSLFPLVSAVAEESLGTELNLLSRTQVNISDLALTGEEWALLRKKRVLRLGASAPNYPPFDITSGIQDYGGISADYIGLIAYNLNVKVQVLYYANYQQMIEALNNGEVDIISNAGDFELQHIGLVLSEPYVENTPAIITSNSSDISAKGSFKKIAIEQSYSELAQYEALFPDVTYEVSPSPRRALEALSFEHLDAFISNATTAQYLINQSNLNNLRLHLLPDMKVNGFSFAAKPDKKSLINIVNKVLKRIPENVNVSIQKRWNGGIPLSSGDNHLALTSLEQKWIEENPVVQVAVNDESPPLSFMDSSNKFRGLTADLIDVISSRTGLTFEVVNTGSLKQTIDAVKSHHADIAAGVTLDAIWPNGLLTTRSYLFNSWVLIGKKGSDVQKPTVSSHIVLVIGHPLNDYVNNTYPDSPLIYVNKPQDGLEKIKQGEAEFMILPMISADFLVSRYYSDTLTIVNSVDAEPARFVIGVSSDEYPLATILDKAILSIPPEDLHNMTGNWYSSANLIESSSFINEKKEILKHPILWILAGITLFILWRYLDVSFRNKKRFKQQVQYQQALLNAIPIPVYITDFQQRLVMVNRSFTDAFNVSQQQAVGSYLADYQLSITDGRELLFQHDKNKPNSQMIIRHLQFEGEERVIQQWNDLLLSENNRADGKVGGWLDITKHEQLINELKQAKETADSASRAKTTFLATMGHEIRTPISAIIGMLELTLRKKNRGDLEPDWQSLQVAHDASHSLLALIGEILDIAKIESDRLVLHPERTNFRHLIESVAAIFEGQTANKGLQFNLDIDAKAVGEVLIDPMRCKQILSNLLSNAIKFTHTGSVTLRILADDSNPDRLDLTISVIDTGQGISDETREKLFQPFSQGDTEERSAGSGLGLYICKTLIEMMAGSVTLTSQLGIGTEITVYLSVPRLMELDMPRPLVVQEIHEERSLNILIAEDNKAGQFLLSQQLVFLKHQVSTASNGKEALSLLQSQHFDLLITDCNMPKMDGFELTQAMRQMEAKSDQAPLIIWGVTADAQASSRERCLNAGMNDCMFKPVSLNMLTEKLSEMAINSHAECEPVTSDAEILTAATAVNSTDDYLCFSPAELPLDSSDVDVQRQFIQLMLDEVIDDLSLIQKEIDRTDPDISVLMDVLHKLSGGVRLIGASTLVEHCVRYQNSPDMDLLIQIKYEIERLTAELSHYLNSLN